MDNRDFRFSPPPISRLQSKNIFQKPSTSNLQDVENQQSKDSFSVEILQYMNQFGNIEINDAQKTDQFLQLTIQQKKDHVQNTTLEKKVFHNFGFDFKTFQQNQTCCYSCFFLGCLKCFCIKKLVSKQKVRYQDGKYDLDLAYIMPTIIAMGFPSFTGEGIYRNKIEMVQQFLMEKHGQDNVKIYNLCAEADRQYSPSLFPTFRVNKYPFPDHNITSIQNIFSFCLDAALFLQQKSQDYTISKDSQRKPPAIAIHCKAGKGRTGLMVCAFLIFSSQQKQNAVSFNRQTDVNSNQKFDYFTDDQALKFYDLKRIKSKPKKVEKQKYQDGKIQVQKNKGLTIPSQIRQVKFFYYFLQKHVRVPYFQNSLIKYKEILREFQKREDPLAYLRLFSISMGPFPKHVQNFEIKLFKLNDKGLTDSISEKVNKKQLKDMIEWETYHDSEDKQMSGKYVILKFKPKPNENCIGNLRLYQDVKIKIQIGQFSFYLWFNNYDIKQYATPYTFIKNSAFNNNSKLTDIQSNPANEQLNDRKLQYSGFRKLLDFNIENFKDDESLKKQLIPVDHFVVQNNLEIEGKDQIKEQNDKFRGRLLELTSQSQNVWKGYTYNRQKANINGFNAVETSQFTQDYDDEDSRIFQDRAKEDKLWDMLKERTHREMMFIQAKVFDNAGAVKNKIGPNAGVQLSDDFLPNKRNFYSMTLNHHELDKFKPKKYQNEFKFKAIFYDENF
eukprot:403362076